MSAALGSIGGESLDDVHLRHQERRDKPLRDAEEAAKRKKEELAKKEQARLEMEQKEQKKKEKEEVKLEKEKKAEEEKAAKDLQKYNKAKEVRKKTHKKLTPAQVRFGALYESARFIAPEIVDTDDVKCFLCPMYFKILQEWNPHEERQGKKDKFAFGQCDECCEWFCPFWVEDINQHETDCRAKRGNVEGPDTEGKEDEEKGNEDE
jgi:hypothetical protein